MAYGGGCPRKEVKLHSSLSDSLAAPQLFPQATEMTYTYTHTHTIDSPVSVCVIMIVSIVYKDARRYPADVIQSP